MEFFLETRFGLELGMAWHDRLVFCLNVAQEWDWFSPG